MADRSNYYDNKKKEMSAFIESEIKNILYNEDGDKFFSTYLEQRKCLWRLSFFNQIMSIWHYGNNFHEVSSKTRWNELAKSQGIEPVEMKNKKGEKYYLYAEPKKGEVGVLLYRPHFYYIEQKDEDGNPILDSTGKPKKIQVKSKYFRLYTAYSEKQIVYSSTQELIKIPDLMGDFDAENTTGILSALKNFCEHNEIQYKEDNISFGSKGYSSVGEIVIEQDDNDAKKLFTAFHEVAHEILHGKEMRNKLHKSIMEGEAEISAAILMKYFGYDVADISAGYIRNWMLSQNISPEDAVEALKASMGRIYKFVNDVIVHIEKIISSNDINNIEDFEEQNDNAV